MTFDQIQLALDVSDKDWYREAADRAACPRKYHSGETRDQKRYAAKLARQGKQYKPGANHLWRVQSIAYNPNRTDRDNERQESKTIAA